MENINKNNLFDFDSNYAMALTIKTQFAGNHIPPMGNLISTTSIRIQILIPQINTEDFYRLSVVDEFHIFSEENNKFIIKHNSNDSVTLLLIRKPKDSHDDISKSANILLPISSVLSSEFILEKSIDELNKELNKNLLYFLTYDTKPDIKIIDNMINKEYLINFSQNIKDKLASFLEKVKSEDLLGLIKDYGYIETYSLKGITEAVQKNDKLYESRKNFDNLNIELKENQQNNHKKIKL
jgi:hypothetical protein